MSEKNSEIVERVAKRLGMKQSEIIDVEQDGDDVLAQTHDGTWTRIRSDGELEFRVTGPVRPRDEAEAAMLRGFNGEPEPLVDETPAEKEPKSSEEKPAPAEDESPADDEPKPGNTGSAAAAAAARRRGR